MQNNKTVLAHLGSNLPSKIAGIVFWGMILTGIITAGFFLKEYRESEQQRIEARANALVFSVSQALMMETSSDRQQIEAMLETLRKESGFSHLILKSHIGYFEVGTHGQDCLMRDFQFHSKSAGVQKSILSVCTPEFGNTVTAYEKNVVVFIGALVVLIGIILQNILRRIISRPIMSMVETAKKIHLKEENCRFDETLNDEFGFLAGFINQALDTTAAKSTELAMEKKANSAKSMFLANMSHEIRTPLTAILGFSESMQDKNQGDADREVCINSIVRNSNHLMQLINDLLDMSKIEANELSVEKLPMSPVMLIKEIESCAGQRVRDKGLDLITNFQFPLPSKILTDNVRLKQILLNLTSNSLKFTESGSISLNLSYLKDRDVLQFSVKDTGIGMDDDEQKMLFKPFSQADISTTRKYGGTGLGLYISRQLANMLGGELNCTSLKGEGTEFILTVPAEASQKTLMINDIADAEMSMAGDSANSTPRLSGNILLAEDSPDNQVLIRMYIKKCGANVTVVENGQQAVESALSDAYDLILMDMQMPVMSGLEAVKMLRNCGCTTPISMLTANAMKEEKDKCLADGANEFLSKPIDSQLFYETLARYLPHRAVSNENDDADSEYDETYNNLRLAFVNSLSEKVDVIEQAWKKEDWITLKSEIHKLKGVGGGYGFPEITNLCRDIEIHIKNSANDSRESKLQELLEVCNEISVMQLKKSA